MGKNQFLLEVMSRLAGQGVIGPHRFIGPSNRRCSLGLMMSESEARRLDRLGVMPTDDCVLVAIFGSVRAEMREVVDIVNLAHDESATLREAIWRLSLELD